MLMATTKMSLTQRQGWDKQDYDTIILLLLHCWWKWALSLTHLLSHHSHVTEPHTWLQHVHARLNKVCAHVLWPREVGSELGLNPSPTYDDEARNRITVKIECVWHVVIVTWATELRPHQAPMHPCSGETVGIKKDRGWGHPESPIPKKPHCNWAPNCPRQWWCWE